MEKTPRLFGSDRKYERWRWQIFSVTWLACTGFYLTRKSFSVAVIEMSKPAGLGLTDAQASLMNGAWLVAYAVGQFVWGICGDRYGTRKVILWGMLSAAIAAAAMGAVSSIQALVVLSALQGLCQSTAWAPLSKNLGNFFSQRERGTVMGLWSTNYAAGGFLGSIFAGYFGNWLGWRWAFFGPAAILFLLWFIFFRFQRNRPEDVGLPAIEVYHGEPVAVLKEGETAAEQAEGSWEVILEVLKNPMVLLFSAVYFFTKPARYAILFWGPKYLNEQLGTDMGQSGALGALFELAGSVSVLLAGVISDKLCGARRNPVSIVCLIAAALLLFFIDKLPHTKWMLGGCLFLIGFMLFSPDSLVSGTAPVDFGTKKGVSTAAGLINGWGSIGAIIGGTVPGVFHERWGWNGVFTSLAGSLLIAGLLLLPKWNALPPTSEISPPLPLDPQR